MAAYVVKNSSGVRKGAKFPKSAGGTAVRIGPTGGVRVGPTHCPAGRAHFHKAGNKGKGKGY